MEETYAGPVIENRPDTWYGYATASEARDYMPQAADEDGKVEQSDNSGEPEAGDPGQGTQPELGDDDDDGEREATPIGDAAQAATVTDA